MLSWNILCNFVLCNFICKNIYNFTGPIIGKRIDPAFLALSPPSASYYKGQILFLTSREKKDLERRKDVANNTVLTAVLWIRIHLNPDPDTVPYPDPFQIHSGSRVFMTKN
jgi:hypothetical protein